MFSTMLITLLLTTLAILTAAVPVPQTGFPDPPADTKYYNLVAVTLPDSPHPEFNGTYLESYHTGAGLSDVTFNASTYAAQGFLNGTQSQFNFSSASNGYLPWFMEMTDGPYSTFSSVQINVGLPNPNSDGAFYFNQTANGSLWWNAAGNSTDPYYSIDMNEFDGWLACNWVHNDLPQLFWLNKYYAGTAPLPANCASVYLIPQYLN